MTVGSNQMNEELQDAYNEWLLKFGFRAIDTSDMTSEDYMICRALHSYRPDDLLNRDVHNGTITYQLKTQNEIINPTRTNKSPETQ